MTPEQDQLLRDIHERMTNGGGFRFSLTGWPAAVAVAATALGLGAIGWMAFS